MALGSYSERTLRVYATSVRDIQIGPGVVESPGHWVMCVGGRGFRRPFSFGSTRGDRKKQRWAEFLISVVKQHNTTEYVID